MAVIATQQRNPVLTWAAAATVAVLVALALITTLITRPLPSTSFKLARSQVLIDEPGTTRQPKQPTTSSSTSTQPHSAAVAAAGGWRSSPHAAATNYTPGLTALEMEKGLVSYGTKARSRRALAKLLAGEPITMAFIGGSVTWGHGATRHGETDYPAKVMKWIRETFPKANHTLLNGAIPGVPSSYFSLCNRWHVPADADLVVVEANINDGGGTGDAPIRRAHERLLRKLLVYEHRPAVLELVFYRYPFPNFQGMDTHPMPYRYHGDDEIGVLAQYYHLPWLSARSLAWDYLKETAIDPKSTKRTDRMQQLWNSVVEDGDHPGDTGHGWLADLIIYWMQQILDDVVRHPLEPADEEEAQAELSAPMYRGNWESKNNTCLMGNLVKELVTEKDPAFEWTNEGTEEKPKWGYISTQPGSSIHLVVNTNVARGMGPDAKVSLALGYLKSYEHMGKFEVSCVDGCTCDPLIRDGHHSEKVSQLYHSMMLVSASDACHLKITVLQETTSGEHKFKLMGLVISEVAGWMIGSDNADMSLSVQYNRGKDKATWGQEGDK